MSEIERINDELRQIHTILSGENEIPPIRELASGEKLVTTSPTGQDVRYRQVINPDNYYSLLDYDKI